MRLVSVLAILLVALPGAANAACPAVPGDYAPGTLDESTVPPTFTPQGDGQVTLADAQLLIGVALGREQIAGVLEDVVLRGSVQPTGDVAGGSGFSVTFTPAGSGGMALPGEVSVINNQAQVTAAAGQSPAFDSQVVAGQYLRIADAFVVVASVQGPSLLTLTQPYAGATDSSIVAIRDMALFNAYDVAFDLAFAEAPTVVLSAQGAAPAPGQTAAVNLMQLDVGHPSGPVDKEGFRTFLFQSPFGPYMPGGTAQWEFIAVGPR